MFRAVNSDGGRVHAERGVGWVFVAFGLRGPGRRRTGALPTRCARMSTRERVAALVRLGQSRNVPLVCAPRISRRTKKFRTS